EDPIVIGCIRKNGSSCESFSDVNNRYFATESGNNLDMLPGAINFSRPGLSANFNDGSGINLSSSSSLNISAGYVGIYAGDITIKAKSKLEAKKGESSFISLENDFYNNAGIVMENGSDKASNGAFDDDPQKGAAEAKKAKAAMESAVKVALAAVVGAVQGAMGKIGECLAGVGNNASSTSNVDLRDSNNKSLMNTQTDVAGYKKDETYITKASKNVKPIDTDPYRVHVGESGDGFWGKVADIWVSTPVYKCLASMARWQDNHQQEMELLNIGMIFAGVTAATVSLPMAENECEIANKNAIKVTNKSSSILDEELEKIISGTKVGSNPELNRLDYLRNKYGKLTSEQINNRINLREVVNDEINRLYESGISKKELGPAVAGVLDTKTGKYYFGINNIKGKVPTELHPIIKERIDNMPLETYNSYEKWTLGAGSHAEVYALNEAMLANPNAKLEDFMVYVVRSGKKLKPRGLPMPRCPHCEYITDGASYFPEVLKYGK
uniref:YwqJ-related putative deaminase n=4 Tax=Clostridium butyricum TaxID=1492 RepID=UPI0022E5EFDE